MAEIQSQQLNQKQVDVKRSKKLSTRVDLTPMVDLGFLLITFFIFTTTMSKPKVMKLALPDDIHKPAISPEITDNMVLTLVLKNDKEAGYYYGDNVSEMKFTDYNTGLRDIILQKQAAIKQLHKKPEDLTVLIKPTDNADYKNVVDVLDEMLITNVQIYMLLDPTKEEASLAAR